MRTKPVTRLLVLALVFMMTLAIPAQAESCILCGKESGNDAYLCAYCLMEMMAEKDVSGGLEITDVAVNEDGSVTLSWTDAQENGPYSVYYELLERAPIAFGWVAAEGLALPTITLTQLAPGVSYVFTVMDAEGNKVESIYFAPAVEDGNEIGAKFHIRTRLRNGRKYVERDWSASEIELDNGKEHCLYVKMGYSMLLKTRHYAFSITVEAPNGFEDVVFSGDLTLNAGKSEVPAWSFVSLEEYFGYLERYYGGVPTGEYLVTMHFDGKHVHTESFTVAE